MEKEPINPEHDELIELVRRCIDKDNRAIREIYSHFEKKVMGICLRYLKNQDLAEDAFQDAFVRIFQKLGTIDLKNGNIPAWIYKVTVNVAIAHWKKTTQDKLQVSFEDSPTNVDVPFSLPDNLEFEMINSLINRLPEQQRIVFNMFAIEGYSHHEISELLSCSEENSRTRLSRAKRSLMNMYININKTIEPVD